MSKIKSFVKNPNVIAGVAIVLSAVAIFVARKAPMIIEADINPPFED